MNKIIALFVAFTAGLETAANVYHQVVTHVPEPIPDVAPRNRAIGFVTAHAESLNTSESLTSN
tara:strand:- start:69 stop:257 length:189 start_codon:yes stop_codon:yes gene_type:complete